MTNLNKLDDPSSVTIWKDDVCVGYAKSRLSGENIINATIEITNSNSVYELRNFEGLPIMIWDKNLKR